MQGVVCVPLGLKLAPAIMFVVFVTWHLRKKKWEASPDAHVVLITLRASSVSKDLFYFIFSCLFSVYQINGVHGKGFNCLF